jgi:hypothetical protein
MSQSDTFSKVISYPVYLFYWVAGVVAAGTIALSYFNSDHSDRFNNVFSLVLSNPQAQFAYNHRYAVVIVFLIFLVIKYRFDLRREKIKWRDILHEIVESNNRFEQLEDYIGSKKLNSNLTEHIISELTAIANCICNIINEYTGHNCHVAIKILWRDGTVETAARSQAGSTHRREADDKLAVFSYSENTAFSKIVDGRKSCFVSNWLRLRRACRCYQNSHRGWSKHYKATAVVPITAAPTASEICVENTYGFICADNHRGGFDNIVVPLLLAGTASRCIAIFLKLSQAENA